MLKVISVNFELLSTYTIMGNQVLQASNHIKYASKKKPFPIKMFNYLQNNDTSDCDLPCIKNKLWNFDVKGYWWLF